MTIIPFIWYSLISHYGDLNIILACTIIASTILLAIQGFIWYTVFQKRKGTPKIFRNVLNTKQFFKYLLGITLFIFVILMILDYVVFNTVLNEKNVSTLDQTKNPLQKFKLNIAVLWSLYSNAVVLIFLIAFLPDQKYGQSYAYFRTIELERTEIRKIERFQKGMRFYDENLDATFGLRIKNMDEIHSSIIFDKPDIRDSKIQKLIANFTDDQLNPARYLGEISGVSQNEFFHMPTDFERFEKYVKIISTIIATITLFIPIALHYLQK